MPITIRVNGQEHSIDGVSGDTPLLHVLRNDLALNAVRYGCGAAQCGACYVLLDGRAVPSCVTPLSAAQDAEVTTVEGLGSPAEPHPVQAAFIEEQAAQCGYCTPGMIIAAAALLARTPRPTDAEIRSGLGGNLCRCGSQPRVMRAVRRAAGITG